MQFNVCINFVVEIKTSEKSECESEMKIIGQENGLNIDKKNETSPVYDGFNSMIPDDSNYANININTALNIPIDKLELVIEEKRKNDNEGFRKEYTVCLNCSMLLEY